MNISQFGLNIGLASVGVFLEGFYFIYTHDRICQVMQ